MQDALYEWSYAANNSADDIGTLHGNIDELRHALDDLEHTIRDRQSQHFHDDTEDYTILSSAQQLRSTASDGHARIRERIGDALNEIRDLDTNVRSIGRESR